jgi:hypothetical protein
MWGRTGTEKTSRTPCGESAEAIRREVRGSMEPAEEAKQQGGLRPARKRTAGGEGRTKTSATRPATDKKKATGSSRKAASGKTASARSFSGRSTEKKSAATGRSTGRG